MTRSFDHDKLFVYRKAIEFVAWSSDLLESIPPSRSIHNQLDRSATSIPLNIAEGNGKYTSADRCRFFDIARGSALESAAALDVIVAKKFHPEERIEEGRLLLIEIVSLLVGLIKSNSSTRVYEEESGYLDDGVKG